MEGRGGDDISLFIQLLAEFGSLRLKDQGPISLLSAKGHSQPLEAACIPWLMVPFSSKPAMAGQVPLLLNIYSASIILSDQSFLPSTFNGPFDYTGSTWMTSLFEGL